MIDQIELFSEQTAGDAALLADQSSLRSALLSAGTWQSRAELSRRLNWPERKIREIAETLGAEIVRCQLGFKLSCQITRDELPEVKQAIDAFHSQAKKMDAYALALSRRLHALIGQP